MSLSLLLKLGFWQLSRAEEKRQLEKTLKERQSAPPVPIESLSLNNKKALKYLNVSLAGSYINEKSIFIDNQIYHGRFGYEIITPFRLKSNNHIVFVSRGWKSAHHDRSQLPDITPVTGEQLLVTEIYVPATNSFFREEPVDNTHWPKRLQHFKIDRVKELFEAPIFPYLVRLGENNPGVFTRYWRIVSFKPLQSTFYAFQWFAMSFALVIVSIVVSTNIVQLIRSK